MKYIVNYYDVKKFQMISLSIYDFKYLKWLCFLLIKFLTDISDSNVSNTELDSVFFLKDYRFIILIVVVSLT